MSQSCLSTQGTGRDDVGCCLMLRCPRGFEDIALLEVAEVFGLSPGRARQLSQGKGLLLCPGLSLDRCNDGVFAQFSTIDSVHILVGCTHLAAQSLQPYRSGSPRKGQPLVDALTREEDHGLAWATAFSYWCLCSGKPNETQLGRGPVVDTSGMPTNLMGSPGGESQQAYLPDTQGKRAPPPHSAVDPGLGPLTFRATVEKLDYVNKELNSQELAGCVGHAFGALLPGFSSYHPVVNLTAYETEVYGCFFQEDQDDPEVDLAVGLTLWPPPPPPRKRPLVDTTKGDEGPQSSSSTGHRNRVMVGRTCLRPTIAHCLAKLSQLQPGEVVLDPCCGVATIPIEAALMQRGAYLWGGDNFADQLMEAGARNAQYLQEVRPGRSVELCAWDARRLPVRDHTVDVVISDLPWGRRELTYNQCAKLYPALVKELTRILVADTGRAYLMTGQTRLLERTMAHPWCELEVVEVRQVTVGYKVSVYTIKHKQRSQEETPG